MQDNGFFCHNAFRPVIELAKIPIAAAQLALMQPYDAGAKIAQKGAVVTDHQQRAAMLAQHVLHPFNGWHVHMVGRFVQQQDIGFCIQRAGKGDTAGFTTRQTVAEPVRIKAEAHQKLFRLVDGNRPAKTVGIMAHGDNAAQGHAARQLRGLRQIGDTGAG